MSTEFIVLTGEANWSNKLFVADDQYGTYQLELVLDKESEAKFKASGSQLKMKVKEDGSVAINPKRKEELEPPRVVTEDGQAWSADNQIGNGSKVSVVLELFPSRKGKGTRLEAVRVDEWVEFDPDNFDPTETGRKALEDGDVPF